MIVTRLGHGVDATGRLDPAALARTDAVMTRYGRRARALHAERIRVSATAAVRDAANREGFARVVRAATGTEPEVIDGTKEAALSFLGGTHGLMTADGPFALLDIGGGSTELVTGGEPGVADRAVSMQMGSVRLTERHVRHDPPATEDLEAMREDARASLEEAVRAIPVQDIRTFVSVAGTATTIQAIALGLDRYDPDRIHRTWLTAAEVDGTLARLASITNEERAALPVMAPGRAEVIVAGGVILIEVMRRFGFERTLVSETDILDGLVFEMVGVG
jgi:exopolyphosphatase/guanosine-5'-triphosphate,3'-diphosphate pyrophosphatase